MPRTMCRSTMPPQKRERKKKEKNTVVEKNIFFGGNALGAKFTTPTIPPLQVTKAITIFSMCSEELLNPKYYSYKQNIRVTRATTLENVDGRF